MGLLTTTKSLNVIRFAVISFRFIASMLSPMVLEINIYVFTVRVRAHFESEVGSKQIYARKYGIY